ncbi:protein of unknown function [Chitinophaga jiangningensis]|uniref:DUF4184 family protein n=1 Tax=Chitinophaga jiangningensis TaxID=1419482 RepID=A0A1M6WUY4_9BACT|nr:DUF4184 family protein [Chitinophaga jiangningensis]SHK97518.1 protein of unknown function [Chitinophaga jiangningensis]
MPFTISHAAIVAPLYKIRPKDASLTGLIIGSMVPDFLYFFRLNPYADAGHHLPGIFLYDLPLAILLAYAWHHWLRYPVMRYAPTFAAARVTRYHFFNWHQYFMQHTLVVLYSVLAGITTHLFLDAFTHESGYFVRIIPPLQGHWGQLPAWYMMQILTSVAGLMVLFYYFFKIPIKPAANRIPFLPAIVFWVMVGILSSIILVINEQVHFIACEGMDYLAVILGGVMYGFFGVAAIDSWRNGANISLKNT